MATKKQKRLVAQEKRAAFMEQIRLEGLAAQRADRERREKAAKDAKIAKSRKLLEEHETKKQASLSSRVADVEANKDGDSLAVSFSNSK